MGLFNIFSNGSSNMHSADRTTLQILHNLENTISFMYDELMTLKQRTPVPFSEIKGVQTQFQNLCVTTSTELLKNPFVSVPKSEIMKLQPKNNEISQEMNRILDQLRISITLLERGEYRYEPPKAANNNSDLK
ncbi:MAG: hypothetical protein LAT82_00505 [Nanoarchaeota archaeon]|nr:hypothetical protein [Nanoarchaeota archaeon]